MTSADDNASSLVGLGAWISRRKWVAAAVLLSIVSALLLARWWLAEPWSRLEDIASDYPVPAGYEVKRQEHIGDRPAICQIKPSCREPYLASEYVSSENGVDAVCDAITTSAREWQAEGFDAGEIRGPKVDALCVVTGEIAGHAVQILGYGEDSDGSSIVVSIWD